MPAQIHRWPDWYSSLAWPLELTVARSKGNDNAFSHFPYPCFLAFYSPLISSEYESSFHLIIKELTSTSPQALRPTLIQATMSPLRSPTPLHQILVNMEEEPPNKRNEVAILRPCLGPYPLPPHHPHLAYAAISVFVAPRTASSQDSSIVRSYPRLSLDSCMAPGKANADSPASPMNTPPFSSCPSPLRV